MRILVVLLSLLAAAAPSAQSDLDALMARVLARRDENWKKLQQYVLNERETLQLTGPGAIPLYGFRHEYLWFPRDGRFIRSPLTANGVVLGEADRAREEQRWLRREERREKRQALRQGSGQADERNPDAAPAPDTRITIGSSGIDIESSMRDTLEPGFVSSAYFLRFKFDPGQYALVGRERLRDRDVLRIEYYPTRMFTEGRTRPNREIRQRDRDVERKMNKVSLVTLWVDPAEHQILKYEFTNIDFDFLPARSLLRLDDLAAAMEMGQPFPGVWLPASIDLTFEGTLAIGAVTAKYDVDYYDYRVADVGVRVR